MGKQRKKILLAALDLIACLVLFICLGLSIFSNSMDGQFADGQFNFFLFLDRHGISLVFTLTVIALILIYINQKILFKTQQEEISNILYQKHLTGIGRKEQFSIYEKVFELSPIGIIQTRRDGKIIFANSKCAAFFGFSSVKSFIEEFNQDSEGIRGAYVNHEARDLLMKKLYDDRQGWCHSNEQFYRKDGKAFYASCYLSLRYDHERDEECILGFIEDISSRIEMQEKLKTSEARYRALIEKSNSIILKINLNGCISYSNKFAQEVFGYADHELIGKHVVGTIIDPGVMNEQAIDEILKEICSSQQGFIFKETLNMRHDGTGIWIAWSNKALLDDDGEIREVLAIGQDMTSRKDLEQSLSNQLAFERALKNILRLFADSNYDEIDQAIDSALINISNFLDACCSCFCLFDEHGFVDAFYQQCSTEQHDQFRSFLEKFLFSSTSWWFEKLSTEEFFVFRDVNDAPENLISTREAFLEHHFSSIIIIPIRYQERFIGFLVSGSQSPKSRWGSQQAEMMKICGQVFLNVLQQKRSQEELVSSRERFDTAVRGAYLGMYDWDINSGNAIFNDIWFRMLGYSPTELPHTHDTWRSLLHPDDKERVLASLTKYLSGSNPFYNEEYRLKTKSGSWKWIHSQGHIVRRDNDGKPLKMIGFQRDITEHKLMADELSYQRDLFSSLIENMPAGIFVKDVRADFKFVVWNKYMEALFGLSRNDVIDKTDYDLFDREYADFYLRHDKRLVSTKQIQQIPEEKIQTSNGECWVQTTKVPIVDDQQNVIFLLGILQDITDQQQLEMQLRHSQKMHSIGQLAAGIAHEIKNPLAIILLAAEGLMLTKTINNPEKLEGKVRMIKESATKANDVILELLKFSRLSDTEMGPVDLHQAISDAYFLAQNRSKEKSIEFEKNFFQEDIICYGNSVLLEQVFINLFNNAIDAIDTSGRIVATTRVKESLINKKEIVVEIQDNGSGIPEKVMAKIFDPFYTTKKVGLGTGLGLSTVFMIMEKHNGTIKVDTQIGSGTTFVLTFPFLEDIIKEEGEKKDGDQAEKNE